MANLILPPGWRKPGREVTPESVYWHRRQFIKGAGAVLAAVTLGACGARDGSNSEGEGGSGRPSDPLDTIPDTPTRHLYPAEVNARYPVDRRLTDRRVAATHNNFYEFLTDTDRVWERVGAFEARPWTVEVAGEVERPGVYDVADLERELDLEERTYRLRCVEAWAMTVPWTGFPLHRLLDKVGPLSSARYVRFVSFHRPDQAIGQANQDWYPWPYYEGLRMDEAMHDLTLVATGIFGAPLPKQHGAPVRIVVPWKYGYKSPKSIVRIELVRERPPIFWHDLQPSEYRFFSNVNPDVAHPRWSQAKEELIGEGRRVPTRLLNGYAEWVADLYEPDVLNSLS